MKTKKIRKYVREVIVLQPNTFESQRDSVWTTIKMASDRVSELKKMGWQAKINNIFLNTLFYPTRKINRSDEA